MGLYVYECACVCLCICVRYDLIWYENSKLNISAQCYKQWKLLSSENPPSEQSVIVDNIVNRYFIWFISCSLQNSFHRWIHRLYSSWYISYGNSQIWLPTKKNYMYIFVFRAQPNEVSENLFPKKMQEKAGMTFDINLKSAILYQI